MIVDGVAAARTLLSYSGIRGGYCLFYVWQAYKAHGASTGRSAPTATEAWNRSDRRHPGDRNPPPGVPVFWGPKSSSNAGDVVISLGGGRVAATDWPRYGVTGVCTIDERERQIGRPYLGWAECIFDQPIALPQPAGEADEPLEEDDMFNDDDRKMLDAIRSVLLDGVKGVDESKGRLAQIYDNAREARNRLMVKDPKTGREVYDVTQLTANEIKPMLLTLLAAIGQPSSVPGAPIDVPALAAAIREGLPEAVADELAERLAYGRTA